MPAPRVLLLGVPARHCLSCLLYVQATSTVFRSSVQTTPSASQLHAPASCCLKGMVQEEPGRPPRSQAALGWQKKGGLLTLSGQWERRPHLQASAADCVGSVHKVAAAKHAHHAPSWLACLQLLLPRNCCCQAHAADTTHLPGLVRMRHSQRQLSCCQCPVHSKVSASCLTDDLPVTCGCVLGLHRRQLSRAGGGDLALNTCTTACPRHAVLRECASLFSFRV